MNSTPLSLRWLAALAMSFASLGPVRGQTFLYAATDAGFRLVKKVNRNRPLVDDGTGKLVLGEQRYTLRPVTEYLPVFVAVQNLHVKTSSAQIQGQPGAIINREFHFTADFESPVTVDDVFVALELSPELVNRAMFVQEIGQLRAHESRRIEIVAPTTEALGRGKFKLHVFIGGAEALNSTMPAERVERALDRIVRDRLKGVTDTMPRPLLGPPPEYPAKLRRSKINGSATLSFTISPTGRIVSPIVKSATDPAFGEAALAVAPMWRFLPRVVGGKPVEAPAEMPFDFEAK